MIFKSTPKNINLLISLWKRFVNVVTPFLHRRSSFYLCLFSSHKTENSIPWIAKKCQIISATTQYQHGKQRKSPAISGTQGEVDIGVQSWLCFQGKHCHLFKFQCFPPLSQSHKVILPSLPLPHHQTQHTKLSAFTFKAYDLEIVLNSVHREMDENYHNWSTTDQNYSSCSVSCLKVLQCFLQIWKNNLCYYATGSGG